MIVRPTDDHRFGRLLDNLAKLSIIGIFLITLCIGLFLGRYVLAPAFAGIMVGFVFGPVADYFYRRGVPPALSSAVIVISSMMFVAAIAVGLSIPVEQWSRRLPEIGTKIEQKWENLRKPFMRLKQVEKRVKEASDAGDSGQPMEVSVQPPGFITNMLSSAPDVFARLVIFVGTFYFFLATRRKLRGIALRNAPSRRIMFRTARIGRDIEYFLPRYVGWIALMNMGYGCVVGLAMYLVGMPSPVLWGVMAAVLEFAPYIGVAIGACVIALVGLGTFPSVGQGVMPVLIFIIINGLHGQFVTPSVLGRTLTLNPLIVFLSLAFWLWLWGPLGAFLAVPIVIMATVVLGHVRAQTTRQNATVRPRDIEQAKELAKPATL